MSPGAWKLEPAVTGVCDPGCMYYRFPDAPQHRHWQQQPRHTQPAVRPDGRVWRLLFRILGGGQPR